MFRGVGSGKESVLTRDRPELYTRFRIVREETASNSWNSVMPIDDCPDDHVRRDDQEGFRPFLFPLPPPPSPWKPLE